MKNIKERIIYNNYDLWEYYEKAAKENLEENDILNPTEDQIYDEIYALDSFAWEDEKERLETFFNNGSKWIAQGYIGRWDGRAEAGKIFNDFMTMFQSITADCDFIRIFDANGHFFIQYSHHDGTNLIEIKKITDKGVSYYDNWENSSFSDMRNEKYIHTMIMNRYSTLPNFANLVYGCSKREYKTA